MTQSIAPVLYARDPKISLEDTWRHFIDAQIMLPV
jgi:hypothetical protein